MDNGSGTDRLARLAAALIRYGIPENLADGYAHGIVLKLRLACWSGMTDLIGTSKDVERLCPGPIPTGSLARLLVKAGVLAVEKNRFWLPSAFKEMPGYVRTRWRRQAKRSFKIAQQRAGALLDVDVDPSASDDVLPAEAGKTNLFGEPVEAVDHGSGQTGHKELVAYWCRRWGEKEGRGAKYPFAGVDARLLSDLIRQTETIDEARATIDAYLRCPDAFYRGKSLKKLIGDLPRFVAAAAGGGDSRPNELAYRGGTQDLPILGPGPGDEREIEETGPPGRGTTAPP